MTVTLAIPSKGRLKDQSLETLARAGLAVSLPGDDRKYRARIEGRDDIEVAFLSASEISGEIGQGSVVGHFHAVGDERADQLVGIDVVLRAAERLDVEALRHGSPRYPRRSRAGPIHRYPASAAAHTSRFNVVADAEHQIVVTVDEVREVDDRDQRCGHW